MVYAPFFFGGGGIDMAASVKVYQSKLLVKAVPEILIGLLRISNIICGGRGLVGSGDTSSKSENRAEQLFFILVYGLPSMLSLETQT